MSFLLILSLAVIQITIPYFSIKPETLNPTNTDPSSLHFKVKTCSSSMAFLSGGRFRELLKKYGKVALGVHFSVSAASITGLYAAIKNNVDVESLLDKLHMGGLSSKDKAGDDQLVFDDMGNRPSEEIVEKDKKRNRTAELAASSGGALALAVLCNKALFPIRVPITMALTPPVARLLARRKIIKNGV